MSTEHLETRRETEAAIAARRELGAEYEDAIAASLADRVEQLVDRRAAELHPTEHPGRVADREHSARTQAFVLGIISLTMGIPITAIGAANVDPSILGIGVSWAGIVGVNVAFNRARRRS